MACGRLAFAPASERDGGSLDGDGGSDAAPIGNRAFVTSTTHVPVTFGGLDGADAVCMDRAREAGLPGRFVAWLSTSTVDARDRLSAARGWYRLDHQPLVDTADDLAQGRMILPLRIDERGNDIGADPGRVVTGSFAGVANSTCSDYTSSTEVANVGVPTYAGGWSMNVNGAPCGEPSRLYCFQVDLVVPVAVTPSNGRTAFVSSATFAPTTGRGAADAICAAEAQANNLPGTYLALLPETENAAARFDLTGPPWVRVDGMSLGTVGELMGGTARVSLNVTAAGEFVDDYVIAGGVVPGGDAADARTCDLWTNPGGVSELGAAAATGLPAFMQTTEVCTRAEPVYCLQE